MTLEHLILVIYYMCEKSSVKLPKLLVADLNWQINFYKKHETSTPTCEECLIATDFGWVFFVCLFVVFCLFLFLF